VKPREPHSIQDVASNQAPPIRGGFLQIWLKKFAPTGASPSWKPQFRPTYGSDDIADAAPVRYYAGLANKVLGKSSVPATMSFTLRERSASPANHSWNYPLVMASWKLAPAIGPPLHLRPQACEQTPLNHDGSRHWFEELGFPPGSHHIVQRLWRDAGAALVAHSGVDKIAFTGSAAVGKNYRQKRATLRERHARARRQVPIFYRRR